MPPPNTKGGAGPTLGGSRTQTGHTVVGPLPGRDTLLKIEKKGVPPPRPLIIRGFKSDFKEILSRRAFP